MKIITTAGEAEDPATLPGLRKRARGPAAWHDTWERLPSLRIPTLVAAGRYDGIALSGERAGSAGVAHSWSDAPASSRAATSSCSKIARPGRR